MKNCLVVLKNKKLNITQTLPQKAISAFSSAGYYFDKISFVAFDNKEEIIRQLKECKQVYDNLILFYPDKMEQTLKKFLASLYGATFVLNQLVSNNQGVFLISDNKDEKQEALQIINTLNEKYSSRIQKSFIKTVGASNKEILTAINKAKELDSCIECNVYGEFGENTIEILYNEKTPKMLLDGVIRIFVTILGEYIYALEDVSLAERLFQLLTLRRMKICVAESFTGGGVGQKLVEVPGISSVFYEGLNTYSNEAKMQRLGVEEMTLKHYGAVSDETCYQMAAGLIAQGNCDVSISTTGIAGPKSDNTNKPVGLCYIGVGLKESVSVYKYVFEGDRENITKTAINHALFLAYKKLK